MKTFAYLRVSTSEQDLQQQLNAIENYIKFKGLKVDECVSDEGVSGGVSYKNRKLNNLLNEMHEGDALVVSEISRLGRSMSDLNKLVNDELKPRKLRLIVISMGMDLDCSNIKAIDEMILFAFGFSSQIEKEMIQERTRNALEARQKKIIADGYFISKKGNKCTKLGSPKGFSENARIANAKMKREKAQKLECNVKFHNFIQLFEEKNGALGHDTPRNVFEQIAYEMNKLGYRTATNLEYNSNRVRALLVRDREIFGFVK